MNYLYTKVSAVREQLILFANQIESLDFEYNAVVAELEQSFTDSNRIALEWAQKAAKLGDPLGMEWASTRRYYCKIIIICKDK